MKKKIIILISIFFIGINFVSAREKVTFSKCVDGDTIKVIIDDKEYTVRMLAVDTPEVGNGDTKKEFYGEEASNYTCKRITKAKKIELEYDPKSDKFDKYDRLLAWVFVDNKLLQEELVEKGYAKVAYLYDDYKYVNILKEKQELASVKKRGVWDEENKEKYGKNEENEEVSYEKYENVEIIVIMIAFLIMTFIIGIKKKIKTY